MKTEERVGLQQRNERLYGTEAKHPRWRTLCVLTKEHPNKPSMLITGEVQFIYPTGDIAFKRVTKMTLWEATSNTRTDVEVPSVYAEAKKVVIRREIIAAVLYLEELPEEEKKSVEVTPDVA